VKPQLEALVEELVRTILRDELPAQLEGLLAKAEEQLRAQTSFQFAQWQLEAACFNLAGT
jgi:hypothetical protein